MSTTRRLLLAGFVLLLAFSVVRGLTSWSWKGQLETPPTITKFATYSCGPVWGSDTVKGAPHQYVLLSSPCGQRRQYQIVLGLDAMVGLVGAVMVVAWGARRVTLAA